MELVKRQTIVDRRDGEIWVRETRRARGIILRAIYQPRLTHPTSWDYVDITTYPKQ